MHTRKALPIQIVGETIRKIKTTQLSTSESDHVDAVQARHRPRTHYGEYAMRFLDSSGTISYPCQKR